MFCNKCGRIIEENTKFCGGCGTPVPIQNNIQPNINISQNVQQDTVINQNYEQSQTNPIYNEPYQNYDNIVNPSMKKYAILSIVIPAISIFLYLFVGLSVRIAIFLSCLGFIFAKKGNLYSKKLAKIGYVLNTILVVISIIMWIGLIILALA